MRGLEPIPHADKGDEKELIQEDQDTSSASKDTTYGPEILAETSAQDRLEQRLSEAIASGDLTAAKQAQQAIDKLKLDLDQRHR